MKNYVKTGKNWAGTVRMTHSDFNNFEEGIVINNDNISKFPQLPQDESRMPKTEQNKNTIQQAFLNTERFLNEQFSLVLPWIEYAEFPQDTAFYKTGKLKESAEGYNKIVSVFQPYIDRLNNIISSIKNKNNEVLMSISKNKYLGQTQTKNYRAPSTGIFPSWVNSGTLSVTRTDTRVEAVYSVTGNMPVKLGEMEVLLATMDPLLAGHEKVSGKITASSGVWGDSLRINFLEANGQLKINPLLPDRYKSMTIEVKSNSKRCTPLLSLKPIDVYSLVRA